MERKRVVALVSLFASPKALPPSPAPSYCVLAFLWFQAQCSHDALPLATVFAAWASSSGERPVALAVRQSPRPEKSPQEESCKEMPWSGCRSLGPQAFPRIPACLPPCPTGRRSRKVRTFHSTCTLPGFGEHSGCSFEPARKRPSLCFIRQTSVVVGSG